MAQVDVNGLTYEPNSLTTSDFNASRDNNDSLSAGTVGEIGALEVGEDGVASQYDAIQIGQPADSEGGDTHGNEMFVNLQAGGSAVSDTAQFSFNARNKGELGGGKAGKITGFVTLRGQDNDDPRLRKSLYPQTPVIPDGRLLTFQAKDETSSVTVDLSQSEFEIPILGGK